jgi:hypothetical protein
MISSVGINKCDNIDVCYAEFGNQRDRRLWKR